MAYFGCSTWPNRGRWLLVVAFCGLAIVLIALHTHETSQCVKCSEVDGVEVCEDYKQGEDTDWSGLQECRVWWLIATAAMFMTCFALCTISCFSMCFATPPLNEHMTIVLSTSAGDSSNHPVAKRGLTIKTRAAGSSNSRTSPLNPMSDAGTSPTPLTPSSLRHAPTPASTTHTASSQPPATTTVDKSSPPPPPHTTGAATAPLSSAAMSRTVSGTSLGGGGDGMLADRALLAFDELLAAAEAAAGGGGAPRARRAAAAAASGMPPADAVGEAALRRSTEACTVASRSTIRPSSYVVLDSEASFSPHSTPTLSSTGRPYAAMYPSAQDLVALEPAAASGGPGRTAGDVLRSIGHLSAASASASDTYGSQLLGPVPDRWLALQPSGSRHSMRSALNAYAAAQAAEDPWAPRSVLSSASGHGTAAVRKSESGSSYYTGRESPAHVEVQLAAAGAESMPEISLHLSGIADTGPIPYPTS